MWIVPLVLIVVGVIGFLVVGGGGAGGIIGGGPDESIPPFKWAMGNTTAISVTSNDKEAPPSATAAAKAVSTALDGLYTEAFLDPANWRDGSYDEVWSVFADEAQGAAQQDASTLTVGGDGDSTYTKIATPKGRIDVRVLLNEKGQVATAVASVRFSALGDRKDGRQTLFRSSGQYFLRRSADGWQVYSFSVDRDDRVREKPSPSATGEAS